MRIGEALALNVGDVDIQTHLLTIRHGKFGKTRILPLKTSTAKALENYIRDPRRPIGTSTTAPVFVSGRSHRLIHMLASSNLKTLCMSASIAEPLPRLHDLRHSFAVRCVMRWYHEERDVNVLLPVLSTYLGHVSVENTRRYLQANGLLLEEASRRFSAKSAGETGQNPTLYRIYQT